MAYVELLWTRKMFAWYAGFVVVLGFASAAASNAFPSKLHASAQGLPLTWLFGISAYATCIMTTMIAGTLNRDREHLAYIWTRPLRRERVAFEYMLVDLATILAAFALVALTAVAVTNVFPGTHVVVDPDAWRSLVSYVALPLMWYGIIEAATSWNALKAGAAAGISWAVFWALLLISAVQFPAPLNVLIAVLNIFNPLAYFVTRHGHNILVDPVSLSHVASRHIIPLNDNVQTVLAYAIFLGSCVVATYAWRRMEA